ncbi:aminotransferase class V-fold PLP-dependent enzyme [Acidobacteriota bacterium]
MVDLNNVEEFQTIRDLFPILNKCVYLNSNSLGAVPSQVSEDLLSFYQIWAEKGVSAWGETWWELPRKIGLKLSSLLGDGDDEIAMIPNASIAHWVALSTQFGKRIGHRKKIVMSDLDFPSSLYAVSEIARFMDWEIDLVPSHGQPGIDVESFISKIDEKTLAVATSHVYYKSGYIQNISEISRKAQRVGAVTLIDGYHAPGTISVNLADLGVDFYVGGCLKWLCGGPGNAFLYVGKNLKSKVEPRLTGWFAHDKPFNFSSHMEFTEGSYKFMSGTPSIPSLYASSAGLDIISRIGISQIRKKSQKQTRLIMNKTRERGFCLYSPEDDDKRGGSVSLSIPCGYQVKQSLEERGIIIDYRQGDRQETEIIRVGPHFYTKDEEIDILFETLDEIYSTEAYKKFPKEIKTVT